MREEGLPANPSDLGERRCRGISPVLSVLTKDLQQRCLPKYPFIIRQEYLINAMTQIDVDLQGAKASGDEDQDQ